MPCPFNIHSNEGRAVANQTVVAYLLVSGVKISKKATPLAGENTAELVDRCSSRGGKDKFPGIATFFLHGGWCISCMEYIQSFSIPVVSSIKIKCRHF